MGVLAVVLQSGCCSAVRAPYPADDRLGMLQHRAGCQGEYQSFNFRSKILRLHQPREYWLTVALQTHLRSSRWLTTSFLPPTLKIKQFYLCRALISHSLELANLNDKALCSHQSEASGKWFFVLFYSVFVFHIQLCWKQLNSLLKRLDKYG